MSVSRTRTRLAVSALSGALLCSLTGVGPAVGSAATPTAATADRTSAKAPSCDPDDARRGTGGGERQTSDGEPGLVVGPPTAGIDGRGVARARVRNDLTYEIAPGITVREWDQVDGRQPIGQVRMNLLTVSLDAPNISFETLAPKYVTNRKPVSTLGRWNNVIGAVNGDFFDICDTGAPLGIGIDRKRGLLNGAREGWIPENMSMFFDGAGPHLGRLAVDWRIRQRRAWTVSGVNHPSVPGGQVGVFTHDWGYTSGYLVTNGKRRAREVVVRKNRVISNRFKLSEGRKIRKRDRVLVGVGSMARKLKGLRKGKKITVAKRLVGGRPTTAITGDRPVLVDGVRTVVNDRLAHPRTAVGIDADGRTLLILVVDGRSSASRGYTMVELANMMAALGAENALNLDGGGSSTMYSRLATGEMGILNEPSDGQERLVPNALGIVYHGELPPVVVPTPTPAG